MLCAIRVLDTWWYKGVKVYVLEKKWTINRLDDIRNFVTTKIPVVEIKRRAIMLLFNP